MMRIGTKSLLYGAHCWFIHPWFVALAWWKLYGFPWGPRLWVMFVVHDWGYWGKPNMDGPEGEDHVRLGAGIMRWLFDDVFDYEFTWYREAFYHSRYMSKKYKTQPSRLCYADKLAMLLTPWGLYIPAVWLTGEWKEYRDAHAHETGLTPTCGLWTWYWETQEYMQHWVAHNKFGQEDTWTKTKAAANVAR